jgi:hypothetical protein
VAAFAVPLTGSAAAQPGYTSGPSITGAPYIGEALGVSAASWSDPGTIAVYDEWEACDTSDVCDVVGFGDRYTVVAADIGDTIEAVETAIATDGTSAAISVSSAVVTYRPPAITTGALPTISGTPRPGDTLTEAHGTWSPDPSTYTYQWERCGADGAGCTRIPDATDESYTVSDADIGSTLQVQETAYDHSTQGRPTSSTPTDVVQATSSVSLASSKTKPVVNETVTLTATVNSETAGAQPSGSMTFVNGSTAIPGCTNLPVNAGGQSATVTCATSFAAPDAQLTAVFTPTSSSHLLGSASSTVVLEIGQTSTSLTLRAAKRAMAGTRVTYTATLALPEGLGGPVTPTGSVQFSDHGRRISSCAKRAVAKLTATCSVTYTLPGGHTITAAYRGDADFTSSTAPSTPLTVTPIPAKGQISATMQWTFFFTPSYTTVIGMVLNAVPYGATVRLGCTGHGCPFTSRRRTVSRPSLCTGATAGGCAISAALNLTSSFTGHQLAAGARITVMISRPGFVGKYYSFTVRPSSQPLVRIACLAPDSSAPGAACTLAKSPPRTSG